MISRQQQADQKKAEEAVAAGQKSILLIRVDMPDDTDGIDEVLEFQEWQVRELQRLKHESSKRSEREQLLADTERRRNMTDAERALEDAELVRLGMAKDPKQKPAAKGRFLQRYHHKGAFYMDEDSLARSEKETGKEDIRRRDVSMVPTGMDKDFNLELLPENMRKKGFGKRNRTKYTHLADQDTSKGSQWGGGSLAGEAKRA